MTVSIKMLKTRMRARFPDATITEVLNSEPDDVASGQVIGKLATWQSIIDAGRQKK